jgi:ATP synthase subunit 6
LIKIIFNFVKITIKNNITKIYFDYTRFLPFFYILFFFVLISNLGGLIPFVYTITSLALVPFFFSLINFIFVSIFIVSGYRTLSLAGFFPAGTNIYIAPLLVLIEIISYFVKLFSLAVRLFANMFAGHVLVKVLLSLA